MREDDLLKGLSGFLAERIFGPDRRQLLAEDLVETDTRAETDRVERIVSLRKTLTDVRVRGERLMLTLETQDDPEGTLFARVRDRVAGLAREERQQQEELRALEAEVAAIPLVEPKLLDDLPTTPIDLSGVPDPVLRPFFRVIAPADPLRPSHAQGHGPREP